MKVSTLPKQHTEKACCHYKQANGRFKDMFITLQHAKG